MVSKVTLLLMTFHLGKQNQLSLPGLLEMYGIWFVAMGHVEIHGKGHLFYKVMLMLFCVQMKKLRNEN